MVETLLSKSTASVPKKGGTRTIANLMHEKIGGLLMKCKSIALESLTFPPITRKPLCLRRKSHCARTLYHCAFDFRKFYCGICQAMLEILGVGSPKKLVRKEFGKLALGKGVEVTCKYSIKMMKASPAAYLPSAEIKRKIPKVPKNSPV